MAALQEQEGNTANLPVHHLLKVTSKMIPKIQIFHENDENKAAEEAAHRREVIENLAVFGESVNDLRWKEQLKFPNTDAIYRIRIMISGATSPICYSEGQWCKKRHKLLGKGD